jgi:hypothetical protein
MRKRIHLWSLLVTFVLTSGCTLTSTSKQWNGRVGPNGKPVYIKSHTNVGLNVGIFIPVLGATSLPKEIDLLTKEIETEQGNVVRMIQSSSDNYWYGYPPFSWVLTPVITTVTADYEPLPAVLAKDLAEEQKQKAEKEKGKYEPINSP